MVKNDHCFMMINDHNWTLYLSLYYMNVYKDIKRTGLLRESMTTLRNAECRRAPVHSFPTNVGGKQRTTSFTHVDIRSSGKIRFSKVGLTPFLRSDKLF